MLLAIRGHDPLPAGIASRFVTPAWQQPRHHDAARPDNKPSPTFHLFPLLPVELRMGIWHLCMPSRVVELSDTTGTRFRYNSRRQQTGSGGRRMPVLASVCYESRCVALERGGWTRGAAEGRPAAAAARRVWFDPSRDAVLLNAESRDDYEFGPAGGDRDGGRGGERLVDAAARARGGVAVPFEVLKGRLGEVFPLLERADLAGPRMVFSDEVFVAGTRRQAAESGLFGRLGEETLLFVGLDDADTLRRIRALDGGAGAPAAPGLRVGNRGFIRWLLSPSPLREGRRSVEDLWLVYKRVAERESEAGRLALAQMPEIRHVVLFRFCEVEVRTA